jgi:hypothetical protein
MTEANREWYVEREGQIFGPFTLEEMIKKKQNADLFDHDFVWKQGLPAWTRAFYVSELKLNESYAGLNRRRYPRFQVKAPCFVTNRVSSYVGELVSLSQGGALIEAQHPYFNINDEVILMVKPSMDLREGFVLRGKVKNKEFIPHKVQFRSSCRYVVAFPAELNNIETKLALK